MAEIKKYYIPVGGSKVSVEENVYKLYICTRRQMRTQREHDSRNGLVSYHALGTETLTGEELVSDLCAMSTEDEAIAKIMSAKLHRCIDALPKNERELIYAIYFCGYSERTYAKSIDRAPTTVQYWKEKALTELRKMMEK